VLDRFLLAVVALMAVTALPFLILERAAEPVVTGVQLLHVMVLQVDQAAAAENTVVLVLPVHQTKTHIQEQVLVLQVELLT